MAWMPQHVPYSVLLQENEPLKFSLPFPALQSFHGYWYYTGYRACFPSLWCCQRVWPHSRISAAPFRFLYWWHTAAVPPKHRWPPPCASCPCSPALRAPQTQNLQAWLSQCNSAGGQEYSAWCQYINLPVSAPFSRAAADILQNSRSLTGRGIHLCKATSQYRAFRLQWCGSVCSPSWRAWWSVTAPYQGRVCRTL